jgi:hypothetical protein
LKKESSLSNLNPKILALSLLAALPVQAMAYQSPSDRFLKSKDGSGPKSFDHEVLKYEITQTLDSVESLAQQLRHASQEQKKEVRESGINDFHLSRGNVSDAMDSVESLCKAFDAEDAVKADKLALKGMTEGSIAQADLAAKLAKDSESVKALREDARDSLRAMHKGANDQFLTVLRSWMMVSEGTLRNDHGHSPTPSPTATPQAAPMATATPSPTPSKP